MGISIVVITGAVAAIFFIGVFYVLGLRAKGWVMDKEKLNMDRREDNGLLRLPTMPKKDEVGWWVEEWTSRCFFPWLGLVVLWLSYFVIWVFLAVAATAAIVGGLHTLRWAVRLKKSLGKLKLSSHEHNASKSI